MGEQPCYSAANIFGDIIDGFLESYLADCLSLANMAEFWVLSKTDLPRSMATKQKIVLSFVVLHYNVREYREVWLPNRNSGFRVNFDQTVFIAVPKGEGGRGIRPCDTSECIFLTYSCYFFLGLTFKHPRSGFQ